jgi:Regulator of volume decrease after cellular swelling
MRELSLTPQDSDARAFQTSYVLSCEPTCYYRPAVEPIFEALSLCASLHPDAQEPSDEDEDDALIDADTTAFEVFTGEEGEELSEVGRVRSAAHDNRYQPY